MLALLVRVDCLADNSSRSYTFTRSPVRIGRNGLNDLPLEWPFVSQWHAVVQFDDSSTTYFDLGSTNGTVLAGQRLGKNVPVAVPGPQAEFLIGKLRVSFSRSQVPDHLVQTQRPRTGFSDMPPSERTMISDGLYPGEGGGPPGGTLMLDQQALLQAGAGGRPAAGATALGPTREQIMALRNHYVAWRQAWTAFYQQLYVVLQHAPPQSLPTAVAFALEQFPEIANEPQMQAVAQSQNVPLPAGAGGGGGGMPAQLIGQLAQYLVPGATPPSRPEEIHRFFSRLAAASDVFAMAFVGLRQGRDQFGEQMLGNYRARSSGSPIEESQDPRQVLAYLLDWNASDGDARSDVLRGEFAEIMTHQVALLSGLMEGVRKMFAGELSPTGIMRKVDETAGGFAKIWPFREGSFWKQYVQVHEGLSEETALTQKIFGREFAKSYRMALGESSADAGGGRAGGHNGR